MTTRASAAVLLAIICGVTLVAAPAGKNGPIPVMTVLANVQNDHPLRVGSDLQGAYQTVARTMTSQIMRFASGSDWALTTYDGNRFSNRRVFFDFSEPAVLSQPAPPIVNGYVQAHLIAKCHVVNVDLLKIPQNASVDCPGAFRFQAPDSVWYRLSFQPDNFPNVNRLRVTCVGTHDATGCKSWTITPASTTVTGADPNVKSRNTLLQLAADDGYGDEIAAVLGDFYLSFNILVTRY